MFFGCPVLLKFLETGTDNEWGGRRIVLGEDTAWWDLRTKASEERPDEAHVRSCAILCVAFEVEGLALAFSGAQMQSAKNRLLSIPTPVKEPVHLDPVHTIIEALFDDVAAENMEYKMAGGQLDFEQVRQLQLERIRKALAITNSSVRYIQKNWNQPSELFFCGREFGFVCDALVTPFDRRMSYARHLLGDHNG